MTSGWGTGSDEEDGIEWESPPESQVEESESDSDVVALLVETNDEASCRIDVEVDETDMMWETHFRVDVRSRARMVVVAFLLLIIIIIIMIIKESPGE